MGIRERSENFALATCSRIEDFWISGTDTGFFSREGKWDAQTMHLLSFAISLEGSVQCRGGYPPRINPWIWRMGCTNNAFAPFLQLSQKDFVQKEEGGVAPNKPFLSLTACSLATSGKELLIQRGLPWPPMLLAFALFSPSILKHSRQKVELTIALCITCNHSSYWDLQWRIYDLIKGVSRVKHACAPTFSRRSPAHFLIKELLE